jgi:hypothetical protein
MIIDKDLEKMLAGIFEIEAKGNNPDYAYENRGYEFDWWDGGDFENNLGEAGIDGKDMRIDLYSTHTFYCYLSFHTVLNALLSMGLVSKDEELMLRRFFHTGENIKLLQIKTYTTYYNDITLAEKELLKDLLDIYQKYSLFKEQEYQLVDEYLNKEKIQLQYFSFFLDKKDRKNFELKDQISKYLKSKNVVFDEANLYDILFEKEKAQVNQEDKLGYKYNKQQYSKIVINSKDLIKMIVDYGLNNLPHYDNIIHNTFKNDKGDISENSIRTAVSRYIKNKA